jgi:probable rRNA maturation factor
VKRLWSPKHQKEFVRRARRLVRAVQLQSGQKGELDLSVQLVSDLTIRALNRDYRDKDSATDVLAFAQREGEGAEFSASLLGDVVISLETAERQRKGHLFTEVMTLLAHGVCHLIGYDHQTDAEEQAMNERARALLLESRRKGKVRKA